MKKLITALLAMALGLFVFAFAACNKSGGGTGSSTKTSTATSTTTSTAASNGGTTDTSYTQADAVTDDSITAQEATSAFAITPSDGLTVTGNVYTITKSGTYALSGRLEGQILVNIDESDSGDVGLDLSGVTIIYGNDAPIKILSSNDVDISAKKGTENIIRDTRAAKVDENEVQGEGAISAKADLKLKGTGVLVVEAGYNNGIYTTKDLKIQKESLKVTARNTALRGNDSITIVSGNIVAISTDGDGMKTKNTDADKDGNVRGDIVITGASVAVYAAGDGIQAAHSFTMTPDEESNTPNVSIYTGSYSGYTSSGAATTSYKGVKAADEVNIQAGAIILNTYDDGLHANYGTIFDAGTTGKGNVNISGGSVTMVVYAPENKTATGKMGPGRWSGQQSVIGADGIHADYKLNITGGTVEIDSSYEGLEANVVNIAGGTVKVAGNDDGINACKGPVSPQVYISGGYLDVSVAADGDTDGIDSNGTYTQTGGVVITRGPSNAFAAAIDADGAISISGGTLIILGAGSAQKSGSVKDVSGLSLHAAGSHTVTVGGKKYTFTNSSSYGKTTCYSDTTVS